MSSYLLRVRGGCEGGGKGALVQEEVSGTLATGNDQTLFQEIETPNCFIVRKLMPVECERLQGFPDDWTKVPYRKKSAENCPDGARYKACGNSMAVPVIRWLGERIEMVDELVFDLMMEGEI